MGSRKTVAMVVLRSRYSLLILDSSSTFSLSHARTRAHTHKHRLWTQTLKSTSTNEGLDVRCRFILYPPSPSSSLLQAAAPRLTSSSSSTRRRRWAGRRSTASRCTPRFSCAPWTWIPVTSTWAPWSTAPPPWSSSGKELRTGVALSLVLSFSSPPPIYAPLFPSPPFSL